MDATAMERIRTASVLGLAVVLAVAGCSAPSAEETPSPSPSGSPTATPTPDEAPSGEPPSAPTSAPPEEWTAGKLTDACIDFQAGQAGGQGEFDWMSPASTQQNANIWYVFLSGTTTTPDGDTVPAEYTCSVSGPPGSPVVKEAPSS